jgi:hypothetical protein
MGKSWAVLPLARLTWSRKPKWSNRLPARHVAPKPSEAIPHSGTAAATDMKAKLTSSPCRGEAASLVSARMKAAVDGLDVAATFAERHQLDAKRAARVPHATSAGCSRAKRRPGRSTG